MALKAFLKENWQLHDQKIAQGISLTLITGLAFVGGIFFGQDQPQAKNQVVITIPDYQVKQEEQKKGEAPQSLPSVESSSLEPVSNIVKDTSLLPADCLYVGSKNSNKYHLATCGTAKRIKSENRRCFASPAIAEGAGYVPGCLK